MGERDRKADSWVGRVRGERERDRKADSWVGRVREERERCTWTIRERWR